MHDERPRRSPRAALERIRGLIPPISRAVARSLAGPRRVGPSTLMLSTPMPAPPRFLALRDELDPDRVFASAFHARTLGG